MRSILGLVASGIAGLAAAIASLDVHGDFVPFFVTLTFAGGVAAWATHPPYAGVRRQLARGVALVWLVAGVWVGVLLGMAATVWQGSGPPPVPDEVFLGIPATAYYLLGMYAGAVLVPIAAFGRASWLGGSLTGAGAAVESEGVRS